ncbi:MAG: hypothetical protein VKI63_05460 [Cyanobium sp.]|nr:hypothetical protein [Cyanobium sp.]
MPSSSVRCRALVQALLLAGLLLLPGLFLSAPAAAAEIRQIRTSTLLQVGDSNRSYSVRLACIEPLQGRELEAMAWLRSQAPRGARVNLRPLGEQQGELLARVSVIGRSRSTAPVDLAAGLLEQGLARPAAAGDLAAHCPGDNATLRG